MMYRPLKAIFLLFFLLFLSSASARGEDGDDFALHGGTAKGAAGSTAALSEAEAGLTSTNVLPEEGGVFKLCEVGGSRIRFSNLAIPGYVPCGNLAAAKTCDPTGKRFFGAGAPYSYLDCNRGPRIQISSNRELASKASVRPALGDLSAELKALESKRNELDALLDGSAGGASVPRRQQHAGRIESGALSPKMGAISVNPQALQDVLGILGSGNAAELMSGD
jgi:hypothetical protein